jgi:transcriptional regulator with XRE-family HTH domain
MTIGQRIIEARRQMSQEKFGEKIGLSKSAISNFEAGTRTPTDRVINDICREFNINEDWLRNGIGEMFVKKNTITLDEYARQRNMTQEDKDFIITYLSIDPALRQAFFKSFKDMFLKAAIRDAKERKESQAAINNPQTRAARSNDDDAWGEEEEADVAIFRAARAKNE